MGNREKLIIATERLLQRDGCKLIGETDNGFLVFNDDDDDIVFVNIIYTKGSNDFAKSDPNTLRHDFEEAMLQWFVDHEEVADKYLRCDEVSYNIINNNRAMARHHVNAIQGGNNDLDD